jgi:hypothetical protein
MLEFARTLIGKKFCSDVAEIPSSIDRLSRAVESLESQLMELNSYLHRGVSVDVTSMPILKQGDRDGDRDNTLA